MSDHAPGLPRAPRGLRDDIDPPRRALRASTPAEAERAEPVRDARVPTERDLALDALVEVHLPLSPPLPIDGAVELPVDLKTLPLPAVLWRDPALYPFRIVSVDDRLLTLESGDLVVRDLALAAVVRTLVELEPEPRDLVTGERPGWRIGAGRFTDTLATGDAAWDEAEERTFEWEWHAGPFAASGGYVVVARVRGVWRTVLRIHRWES